MNDTRFNLLTDPWIPLDDGQGHATYPELLTGRRDAADLVHPRDDCRFFARMLLSALTQALFPAADAKELRARIEKPLGENVVTRRIGEVAADFELVGGEAFMQTDLTAPEFKKAKPGQADEPATACLFIEVPRNSRHRLFRPAADCDAICPECAGPIVYGQQAFAMEDGRSGFGLRGKSPSVRGRPATTTLISLGSVRSSIWANTLHQQTPSELTYAPDADRPWKQERTDKTEGQAFGLLEGLFWQPRAFSLRWTTSGPCYACGRQGPRLMPVAWRSKSRAGAGEFFRHPWSPVIEDLKTRTLDYLRLSSARPAWTGMVDLLSTVAGDSGNGRVAKHAAPVVRQWFESLEAQPGSLTVFHIGTTRKDRATPDCLVVEAFPLSQRLTDRDVADGVRCAVGFAEKALFELKKACVRVHMHKRPGEILSPTQRQAERTQRDRLHDVTASFWQRTEPHFWAVYEQYVNADAEQWADAYSDFQQTVTRVARELFDEWAAPSLADPSRVALIADAGRWLGNVLAAARAA